jgi:hypothetical protein
MLLMRHSKRKKLLFTIFGILLVFGITILYWCQRDNSESQTEWTTYVVSIPSVSEDRRGDYFSFQHPKSEYIQLNPGPSGRLLRFQNYDPNIFSRETDGRYNLEFFIDTEGHISCEENVTNAKIVNNSKGTSLFKGQPRPNEVVGGGTLGIAACIQREGYILYMQGSDHTGKNIVEQMIDSIHYQD